MTAIEIANLEHASRSSFAFEPEGYDGKVHYGALLGAALPAIGILLVAAAFLVAVL